MRILVPIRKAIRVIFGNAFFGAHRLKDQYEIHRAKLTPSCVHGFVKSLQVASEGGEQRKAEFPPFAPQSIRLVGATR
jgi:hypothetical protein